MNEKISEWISVEEKLPAQGEVVETKIDDWRGVRNEQRLKLLNRLWFFPDGSMYVYYSPTHWRSIQQSADHALRGAKGAGDEHQR